jgi:hypothetical protein
MDYAEASRTFRTTPPGRPNVLPVYLVDDCLDLFKRVQRKVAGSWLKVP